MPRLQQSFSFKALVVACSISLAFPIGIILLHTNPYWHPVSGGLVDHRCEVWSGVAHLSCAIGLVALFFVLVSAVSLWIPKREVYWILVLGGSAVWMVMLGPVYRESAAFSWTRASGVTKFEMHPATFWNAPRRAIVR